MRVLVALLLVLVTLPGCEAAPPEPAENSLGPGQLSRTGGCGDAFVFVTDADDSIAVTIEWPQAASRAQATGQLEESADLPAEQVSVRIQFGQELSAGFCTDIIEPDRPRILAQAPASFGEVGISLLSAPGAEPFMPLAGATVTLSDVVFEVPVEERLETWRIESLELRDVQVGWFAG